MTKFEKRCHELVALLRDRNLMLAAAESCTGGAFMAALVKVPGASAVLCGGMVTYNDEVKANLLGVNRNVIERFGAVSEQVASEMAVRIRKKLGSDIGVGVTGFAGPSGERVGEVCFGFDFEGKVSSVTKKFSAMSRGQIIDAGCSYLVEWLCEKV